MAQAVGFPLPALADELLIGIIEQLEHAGSKNDLCNLALASSRFQALVEPALYQSILVRKGTTVSRLHGAILGRPVRANFIRSLHIRYLHTHRTGIGMLNHGLRKMCNLQELTIEGPCCNDKHSLVEGFESKGEIDYAEYFTFASSMVLESHPRVQVPLQTCKFTLLLVSYLQYPSN
jgi:hypothetical protein